jgi:hypothetical protein
VAVPFRTVVGPSVIAGESTSPGADAANTASAPTTAAAMAASPTRFRSNACDLTKLDPPYELV